jgi:uncharacterized phage-associated protein
MPRRRQMTETDKPAPIIKNTAIGLTNWLIEMNRTAPVDLTHLKIQKLLYFAQGWHLAYFDFPLFEDPVEAWKYGPVVTSVYYALRSRKNEFILPLNLNIRK